MRCTSGSLGSRGTSADASSGSGCGFEAFGSSPAFMAFMMRRA